jgi:hypothetical protein
VTHEAAVSLLAAWLSCWAAEERALAAAGSAHILSGPMIREHAALIQREREQLRPLLLSA